MNLILNKVLASHNIEVWSRLKKEFFEAPYTEIYLLINKFYQKYDSLPSFEELEIVTRDEKHANYITALKELVVPEDIDIEIMLQALINEYAQREVLQHLSSYLDDLVFKDAGSIVEDLSEIALDIDEKTEVSEHIIEMNYFRTVDLSIIQSRIPLGLNNDYDRITLGSVPGELILVGGFRGAGKSVVCSNVVCTQYTQNNAALYFTIEMSAREIFDRNLAILSGVYEENIKAGNLSEEEKWSIAKVRAGMTSDGSEDLLNLYEQSRDFEAFETKLLDRPLKKDNRIITIDNSNLTLTNIDAGIQKYKTQLGDKLKVVVVDYINQINIPDAFNWQVQIQLAKSLKALARKYDVVLFSPFQISEEGKVRFSKGLLDSADAAFNLTADNTEDIGSIAFENKKIRGSKSRDFASEIFWPTLKIYADRNIKLMKDEKKPQQENKTTDDLKL